MRKDHARSKTCERRNAKRLIIALAARLREPIAFSPRLAIVAASVLASVALTSDAIAASNAPQDFYKGKVLTLIVPYGAAGGYEFWAAAIKPYLEQALGVSRIDLVNKPGGGGVVGANYLYAAEPDGLTIGEINGTGAIFAQIIHKPGFRLDMTKFDWLGSPNVETTVTAARAGSPYQTFADLMKLKGGSTKVVGLSAGYGGEDYVGTTVPMAFFGIPYEMLLAYQGSSAAKAGLLRGDGDIATYGYSVFSPLIASKNVTPLFIDALKKFDRLPNIPTIVALAKKYDLSPAKVTMIVSFARVVSMGKDFSAPPNTPPARLAFLRAGFEKAVEAPGFVAAATKAGRIAGYTSPAALEKTISLIIKQKKEYEPFLK